MWVYLVYVAVLCAGLCSGQGSEDENRSFRDRLPLIRAVVKFNGAVNGVVKLFQLKVGGPVYLRGSISGLTPGEHGFHVHEKGDLSGGCATTGSHYNPDQFEHGPPNTDNGHRGDLPMITANSDGDARIDTFSTRVALFGQYNIIGRAIVVHALPDDYGFGENSAVSKENGSAGDRVGCGVIVSY